jgi:uncharacterized protein YjiS (DUF1127 family)
MHPPNRRAGGPSRRGLSQRSQTAGIFDVVRNLPMRLRERRMPLELDNQVLRDIGLTRGSIAFC